MQNIQLISVSPAVFVAWFLFPYELAVGACLRISFTAWVNLFPVLSCLCNNAVHVFWVESLCLPGGYCVYSPLYKWEHWAKRGCTSHSVLRDDNCERRGMGTWQGMELECPQPLMWLLTHTGSQAHWSGPVSRVVHLTGETCGFQEPALWKTYTEGKRPTSPLVPLGGTGDHQVTLNDTSWNLRDPGWLWSLPWSVSCSLNPLHWRLSWRGDQIEMKARVWQVELPPEVELGHGVVSRAELARDTVCCPPW